MIGWNPSARLGFWPPISQERKFGSEGKLIIIHDLTYGHSGSRHY